MILNRQLFDLKLKSLREFQQKYPTSHVGGSIGLSLRGIDLQRDLSSSDLDITIDEYEFDSSVNENVRETSHDGDFDLICKVQPNDSKYHVKIEIRICPEPSFEEIEYEGYSYNVSKLRDILYWKKKYSRKGFAKHKNDLITIETGIRPIQGDSYIEDDELPF